MNRGSDRIVTYLTIHSPTLLQLIHFRFRKSLAQEKFKSKMEYTYQIIVSVIKFRSTLVAKATVRSKAAVLLLMIHLCIVPSIVCGFSVFVLLMLCSSWCPF